MDYRTPSKRPLPLSSTSSDSASPETAISTHYSEARERTKKRAKKWKYLERAGKVKERMENEKNEVVDNEGNKETVCIDDKLNTIIESMARVEARMEEGSRALREEVKDLKEELRATKDCFMKEIKKKDERIAELEVRLREVGEAERRTAGRLNDLDQYNRRNNVRVFGVPENSGENCENMLREVFEKKMGVKLSSQDFEACHRVGGEGKGGGRRAIIARFVNRKSAEEVIRNRKKLKSTGIGISEDLTNTNYRLLQISRDIRGLTDCWSRNGTLYVKTEKGEVRKISTESELTAIQSSAPGSLSINERRNTNTRKR